MVENYEAYCFRCKSKKVVKDPKIVQLKRSGMNAVRGLCPDCDSKMYSILPKNKKENDTV